MQQLTSMDEVWFSLETDATPMHITFADIFATPDSSLATPVTHAHIVKHLERKLPDLPLRLKLANVPMRLDNSYWIEDEDFDLDYHIHEVRLPKPGTWDQFKSTVTEIASVPLDLKRPLWEITLVTGLDKTDRFPRGSFAIVSKLHHAQFDGGSIMRFFTQFYDSSPDPSTTPPVPLEDASPPPSNSKLLFKASANAMARPAKLAMATRKIISNLPNTVAAVRSRETPPEGGNSATHFYANITSSRRVAETTSFELKTIQAIRQLADGAKINDVVIALCGGAVRRFLENRDALPDGELKVLAPISLRKEDEVDQGGNKVSFIMPNLGASEPDPIARLNDIVKSTTNEKEMVDLSGGRDTMELFEHLPGALMDSLISGLRKSKIAGKIPKLYSGVSITNVPGSREPLFICGGELVGQFPIGFLMPSMGLLIIVSSYIDELLISITSTPELLSDPNEIMDCIQASFEEYAALV